MHNYRKICDDLYWVGGSDKRLALFENIHPVEHGVSYNNYLLLDENTVLFDATDNDVTPQMLENVEFLLNGRKLDYLVINHMEPDHCQSIDPIIRQYPDVKLISTEKAFMFMLQYGYRVKEESKIEVDEGDTFTFGKHTVAFVKAEMVHWPEAMVTFDVTNGVLFSADAFGSFRSLDGKMFADQVDFDRDWIDEARRYYTNIVGKYGPHVQALLKKATPLLPDIKYICPLHGLVWRDNFGYILDKYTRWSTYTPEETGVLMVYSSMYGNTESVCQAVASKLVDSGVKNISVYDVSKTDPSFLIADTFKYSHIILAGVTYNLGIYPKMQDFLHHMAGLHVQKRTVGIIENGTWACTVGDLMEKFINDEMKDMNVIPDRVSIASNMMGAEKEDVIDNFVKAFVETMDLTAK